MSTKYVDLGAGFFLTDGDPPYAHEVCDANSPDPDIQYGPAAWNGGVGPASSRRLMFLEPADMNSYMAAVQAHDYAEGGVPPGETLAWPARATVLKAGRAAGLEKLHGKQFENEGALCAAVRAITRKMPRKVWSGSSSAARLESANFAIPLALGMEGAMRDFSGTHH